MASAHDACWKATSNALKFLSLQVILARPLPWLACKMNALATWFTCQWLMGPSKVNDVETDNGKVRWTTEQDLLSPRHTCLSGIGNHCRSCLIVPLTCDRDQQGRCMYAPLMTLLLTL